MKHGSARVCKDWERTVLGDLICPLVFLQSGVCNFFEFFFCKICHCGGVEKPTEPGYVLVEIKSCGGPQSSRRIMNPTLHPGGARMMLIT